MKTTIITFNLEQFSEIISGVQNYSENENFNVVSVKNLEDVHEALGLYEANIFIFSIESKEVFQGLVGLFKAKFKDIKSGRLKLAYAQKTKSPKVESVLNKFLCNDFLDEKISTKSIVYKIEIWSRNVLANTKKIAALDTDDKTVHKKTLQDKTRRSNNINKLSPLEGEFDIWLSPKNNCKSILAKWLVSLYGPSPLISSWQKESEGLWKFVIESDYEKQFLQDEGAWYFEGLRPEFNWKEKVWSFTSSNFNLYFVDSKQVSHIKAKWNFTDLDIKSNSDYANSLLQKIVNSTINDNGYKAETKNNLENSKKEVKGTKLKKEFLEAESKTDKINSHMSGDSKPEENKGGHYSGKLKDHSVSKPSEVSFQNKNDRDKDLSGQGASADKLSSLSGSIDTLSNEKGPDEENQVEKNEDTKGNGHNSNSIDIDSLKKNSRIQTSSQSETPKKRKDTADVDRTKNSKQNEFDKGPVPTKDKKSEMLDAMVNPSKNAVRLTHGTVSYLCDLVDLFEEELYVSLSGNELEVKAKYSVVISMDMGKSKVSITTEGTVDSVDEDIYKILVSEIPSSEYENFMKSFEERQDDINDFIQKARGF